MSGDRRLAAGVIALALLSTALQAAGLAEGLRYERTALAAGEWWRLLGAHLVHLGPAHLALNLAGLALVALLVGRCWAAVPWLGLLLASALTTTAGLWWFAPGVGWYVGLSGVLHGLLAAGAARALVRGPERGFHALLLALLALKLGWEQYAGALPGAAAISGGTVIVDAHLFGTLGGLLGAGLIAGLQVVRGRGKGLEPRMDSNEEP